MDTKILRPFDVIVSPYVDLDGNIKTFDNGDVQKALFMVVAVDYDNLICCKITSRSNDAYLTHSIMLPEFSHPFLKIDSFVQLDKLHTLNVSSASVVGSVDRFCRTPILKVFSGVSAVLCDNLRRFCDPPKRKYVSPNAK